MKPGLILKAETAPEFDTTTAHYNAIHCIYTRMPTGCHVAWLWERTTEQWNKLSCKDYALIIAPEKYEES